MELSEQLFDLASDCLDDPLRVIGAKVALLQDGILREFGNPKRWRYDGTTWRFYGEDPVAIAKALVGVSNEL